MAIYQRTKPTNKKGIETMPHRIFRHPAKKSNPTYPCTGLSC